MYTTYFINLILSLKTIDIKKYFLFNTLFKHQVHINFQNCMYVIIYLKILTNKSYN